MGSDETHDTLEDWLESSPYWTKHADAIREMLAPITAGLIEQSGIAEGQVVLDIAGGVGDPSLPIGEKIVGGPGRVTCTDAVLNMVSTANQRANHRGLDNIDFVCCLGDSIPFPSGTFDVVVSRLGVMLFANPSAAIAEMLRVLKPGGVLSLAVWARREANPFFYVVAEVIARYIEAVPEPADAPGAFRFAEPGSLAAVIKEAGGIEVTERSLKFNIESALTPEQYWPIRVDISDTLRKKVAALSPDQRSRAANEAIEASRKFFPYGKMHFPAEVNIVSARNPSR